ncbi:MAG TPA: hypothetical protein VFL17_00445 [Anaerolineae bacterium]|nr:hypothetical protein [Anaerolineae bacterium]
MTDLLSALSGLPSTTILTALVITVSLLVIVEDWRVLNLLLGVEYLLIGALLIVAQIDGFPVVLAIVKSLVGVMIVPALYISARRARWGKSASDADEDGEAPARRFAWLRAPGLALHTIVAVLGAAVALSLALRSPVQFITPQSAARDLTIAVFVLFAQGTLNVALSENPLKVGLGLLTVIAGFELLYTPVEPTLLIVALLGVVNLLIALAFSYLIAAWATGTRGAAP